MNTITLARFPVGVSNASRSWRVSPDPPKLSRPRWYFALTSRAQQAPQLVISGPISNEWQLTQPLTLAFERDNDGTFIFSDDLFFVYGAGEDPREALHDYYASLIELYELTAQRIDETPEDRAQHLRLAAYLEPIA